MSYKLKNQTYFSKTESSKEKKNPYFQTLKEHLSALYAVLKDASPIIVSLIL